MATNGRQILLVYVWKGARGAPLITDIILGEIPAERTAYQYCIHYTWSMKTSSNV